METLKIYSVYDTKAQTWMTPITDTEVGFDNYMKFLVNESRSEIQLYATDFMCFELGEFNIMDGNIVLHPEKKVLTSLVAYKKPEVKSDE